MKPFTHALLILTAFITLSACSQISSNDVEASAIYGQLSLDKTEGSSQATVSATFYVGGSTGTIVELADPAKVTINGQAGAKTTDPLINMTSYVGSTSGNASVVYTDKEGSTYTNTLTLPGNFSLSLGSSTVFISQGLSFSYSSASVFASGDQVMISLSGNTSQAMFMKSLSGGASSGSANVSSSELSGMSPGSYSMKICRRSSPSAQAPFPKGTSILIQSCSASRTINLQL